MWNSEAPLKLLKYMPDHLTREHLKDLQTVIEKDRFKLNKSEDDSCDDYAPICSYCDKSVQYPCAVAYIKMKQAEGVPVEIDSTEPKNTIRIAIAKRK